jgi:hypothetical protein
MNNNSNAPRRGTLQDETPIFPDLTNRLSPITDPALMPVRPHIINKSGTGNGAPRNT